MNGIFGSGSVFGEQFSSSTDGPSYQASTTPDVATAAVFVDLATGIDSKHFDAGTLVYITNTKPDSTHVAQRRRTVMGAQEPKVALLSGNSGEGATKLASEKIVFPTVAVGDFTVYRGKPTYIAVALQNVANVQLKHIHQTDLVDKVPGNRMYFGLDASGKHPQIVSIPPEKGKFQITRRLTFTQQPTHSTFGTVPMDIGTIISYAERPVEGKGEAPKRDSSDEDSEESMGGLFD